MNYRICNLHDCYITADGKESIAICMESVWRYLFGRAGLVPVDDIGELPGVLVELEFELSLLC